MHIHWYEQKRQIHQENHFQINGNFQGGTGQASHSIHPDSTM
jgi:hypothetical protein